MARQLSAGLALGFAGPHWMQRESVPTRCDGERHVGGSNTSLLADDTSAHIHVGCTNGNVHVPIVLDLRGRFDVTGVHNITAHPVDLGILHPARFSGTVHGRTMTLTVALTDTAVTLGPVQLTFEKEPNMGPCPICFGKRNTPLN